MFGSVRRTALVLGVCAFALYLFRLATPETLIYDEVYHAVTAVQLARDNPDAYSFRARSPDGGSYEWVHPALAKLPMQLGVRIFGANPFGWRIASAVFGALGIGILYVLGTALFGARAGLYASLFMLFDGMWFVQSRICMNDVFVVCFLMLAYWQFHRYLMTRSRRALMLSGVALGFAVATKWSAFYSLGCCGLLATILELRDARRSPRQLAKAFALLFLSFIAIPLSAYLIGYSQYFAMGYSLRDFTELERQIWWYHTHLNEGHAWASRWWTWPFILRPLWAYANENGDRIAHVFSMGNPALWWAFLPAIAYVLSRFLRATRNSPGELIVLMGFLGQWLPWALSPRISFIYHMLPSVPFGCLALAYAVTRARKRWVAPIYLGLVVATFAYFYPHYAAVEISKKFSQQHYWLPGWNPYR